MSKAVFQARHRSFFPLVFLLASLSWPAGWSADAGTPSTVGWEDTIQVATGNAHRGPWRMNDSNFDFVDDPSVAINADGLTAVVWADHSRQDLFLQLCETDGTPRFDSPTRISNSPEIFSWLPRVLITSDHPPQIHVLWQEIVFSGGSHGGEIYFARSLDGGETFSPPLNLSNTEAGAGKGRTTSRHWHNGSLDLMIDQENRLFAAWTEYEGNLWFSRSLDGGTEFSPPLAVHRDDGTHPARGPSLASAKDGTLYLVWTAGDHQSANIHLATSQDHGESFSPAQPVHPGEGHADAPKLAADLAGAVHLVYGESPRGTRGPYRIFHTRMEPGASEFGPAREISLTDGDRAGANFPSIGVDDQNRLMILWERFPDRGHRSQGLGYVVSDDQGVRFSSPSIVPGTNDPAHGFNGSQQGLLMRKLAVGPAGQLRVVNSTYQDGVASTIWLIPGAFQRDVIPAEK